MKIVSDFNFSNFHLSEADVRKALTSPEGLKLLQILNRDGGQKLREAAEALKSGQSETAQQILAPLMATDEAAQLLQKFKQG